MRLIGLDIHRVFAEAAALFQVVIAACATLVPILGGHIADLYGYRPLIVMSATIRFIAACAFVWPVPNLDLTSESWTASPGSSMPL